jgi:hypothetical protein
VRSKSAGRMLFGRRDEGARLPPSPFGLWRDKKG